MPPCCQRETDGSSCPEGQTSSVTRKPPFWRCVANNLAQRVVSPTAEIPSQLTQIPRVTTIISGRTAYYHAARVQAIEMSIPLRKLTSTLLLAVFVAVSALGEGLHAFPGASHHHAGQSQCCHHSQGTPDETGESLSGSHDDCSICRFLAQSIDLSAPASSADWVPCVILPPIETPTVLQDRCGLFDARAPPTA